MQLKEAVVGHSQTSDIHDDWNCHILKSNAILWQGLLPDYKKTQLRGNTNFQDFKKAKNDLNDRMDKLRNELNQSFTQKLLS